MRMDGAISQLSYQSSNCWLIIVFPGLGAEKAMRSLLALQLGLATGLLFSTAIRAVAWWKKFLEDRASKRDEVMRQYV